MSDFFDTGGLVPDKTYLLQWPLTWRSEPPDREGWWWCESYGCLHVTHYKYNTPSGLVDQGLCAEIDGMYERERTPVGSEEFNGCKWAGPIPEPSE